MCFFLFFFTAIESGSYDQYSNGAAFHVVGRTVFDCCRLQSALEFK